MSSLLGTMTVMLQVSTVGTTKAMKDIRTVDRAVQATTSNIGLSGKNINQTLMSISRTLTQFVSLPLGLLEVASTRAFSTFEFNLHKVTGLVGIFSEQTRLWGEEILNTTHKVGKGTKELSDALYFVTTGGIRGVETMETLGTAAKLSAVGLGETSQIADILVSAMNAYGKANLSAAEAGDTLIRVVREGKAEASELVTSMGVVFPVATQLGVSFGEVGAGIAAMTRTGTSAATSATQLRRILFTLLKPTQQAEAALKQMGTSSAQLRDALREEGLLGTLLQVKEMMNTFGEDMVAKVFPNIRALAGVLDILGENLDENIKLWEEIANAGGDLDDIFTNVQDTLQFKVNAALRALNSTMVRFGSYIGKIIIPVIDWFTKAMSSLSSWFGKLSESSKKWIARFLLFVTAVGPALAIFTGVRTILLGLGGVLGITKTKTDLLTEATVIQAKATQSSATTMSAYTLALNANTAALTANSAAAKEAVAGIMAADAAAKEAAKTQAEAAAATAAAGTAAKGFVATLRSIPLLWKILIALQIGKWIVQLISHITKLSKVTKVQKELISNIAEGVADEKSKIESYLRIAKNEEISRNTRIQALEKLKELAPEYLSDLTLETLQTQKAADAIAAYTDNLEQRIRMESLLQLYKGEMYEYEKALKDGTDRQIEGWQKFWLRVVHSAGQAYNTMGDQVITFEELLKEVEDKKAKRFKAEHDKTINYLEKELTVRDGIADNISKNLRHIRNEIQKNDEVEKKYNQIIQQGGKENQEAIKKVTAERKAQLKSSLDGINAFVANIEKEIKTVESLYRSDAILKEQMSIIFSDTATAEERRKAHKAHTERLNELKAEKNMYVAYLSELKTYKGIIEDSLGTGKGKGLVYIDPEVLKIVDALRDRLNAINREQQLFGDSYDVLGEKIKAYEKAITDYASTNASLNSKQLQGWVANLKMLENAKNLTDEITNSLKEQTKEQDKIILNEIERQELLDKTEKILKSFTLHAKFPALITVEDLVGLKEMQDLLKELEKAGLQATTTFQNLKKAIGFKEYQQELEDFDNELDQLNFKVELLGNGFGFLDQKLQLVNRQIRSMTAKDITQWDDEALTNYTNKLFNLLKVQRELIAQRQLENIATNASIDLLWTLGEAIAGVEDAYKKMGQIAFSVIEDLIKMILKEIVIEKVKDAIKKEGIKTLNKETASTVANTIAKKADTVESIKNTVAGAGEGVINATKEGAKMPFPINIIAIATGVAAVLGGIAAVAGARNSVKMAQGGIVPPGYPNDTYPALLSSKEMVVPPHKLPDFTGIDREPMEVVLDGEFRVKGRDLVYVFNEEQRRVGNVFG